MSRRGRPPLSQHFLHDRAIAARIASSIQAPGNAAVLEIGPGEGALTEHLIDRGWDVTAVEIDRHMIDTLTRRFGGDRLRIIRADVLDVVLEPRAQGSWYVIGNLPYAITSPVVFHMIDQIDAARIAELVFMVQREVALRMVAGPGGKQRGALSIGVQVVCDAEILFDVEPGAFRPPPRVRSSVVRLSPHNRWRLGEERRRRLRGLVRSLFQHRRKQIGTALRLVSGGALGEPIREEIGEEIGLELSRRPETLTLEEWLDLDAAVGSRFPHFPRSITDSV